MNPSQISISSFDDQLIEHEDFQNQQKLNESTLLRLISFSFGIYFDDPKYQQLYYAGLFFKVAVQKKSFNHNKNAHSQINESSQQKNLKKDQDSSNERQYQKLISQSQPQMKLGGNISRLSANQSYYDTLAVGGRYDNLISQFQVYGDQEEASKAPLGYNLRIFCLEILTRIAAQEKQFQSFLDVLVVSSMQFFQDDQHEQIEKLKRSDVRFPSLESSGSSGRSSSSDSLFEWAQNELEENDQTEKSLHLTSKIMLVQELRRIGIRADSDNQIQDNSVHGKSFNPELYCKDNNIRFLITFNQKKIKKSELPTDEGYQFLKVRIRDFKSNTTTTMQPKVQNSVLQEKIQQAFYQQQQQIQQTIYRSNANCDSNNQDSKLSLVQKSRTAPQKQINKRVENQDLSQWTTVNGKKRRVNENSIQQRKTFQEQNHQNNDGQMNLPTTDSNVQFNKILFKHKKFRNLLNQMAINDQISQIALKIKAAIISSQRN